MSNRRIDLAIVCQHIRNAFIQHPEIEEDAVLRADMFEGGDIEGQDLLRMALAKLQELDLLLKGLEFTIGNSVARQGRLKHQRQGLKEFIKGIMEEINLRKIILSEATLSIDNSRSSVVIIDLDLLPDEYVHIERKPDLSKIGSALKSEIIVPGATLNNPEPHLTIRTR